MKFFNSSIGDLGGLENSLNFQIIEPCKFVQWPWHSDKYGCFLLLDKLNNEYYHIYRHQTVHLDNNGDCVADHIKDIDPEYSYSFRYYFADTKPQLAPAAPVTLSPFTTNTADISLVAQQASKQTNVVDRIAENTVANSQLSKFSVRLGVDVYDITGALDPNVHGVQVLASLQSILNNYCTNILPAINSVDTITWNFLEKTAVVNHLLPEQLFDVVVRGGSKKFLFLRPCSIVSGWSTFLNGVRNQIMCMIRLTAESNHPDINDIYMNKEKFREKKVCSASTFASSRHIVNEFRCAAKNVDKCPHIIAVTNEHGHIELSPNATLCHFLLSRYLENYDESLVNVTFGFKCQFAIPNTSTVCSSSRDIQHPPHQSYNRSIDYTQNNVNIFQALMGRHVMLHRMCLPAAYVSVDWFRFVLKLLDLEKLIG